MKINLHGALALVSVVLLFTSFINQPHTATCPENGPLPGQKREYLSHIIGRWITQTTTLARDGQPSKKVIGSDIYQWSPDGNFVLHTAYGIGDNGPFGALEIIGYDKKSGNFLSYNFNGDGTFTVDKLIVNKNVWVWTGKKVRSTGIMDTEKGTLTVKHELTGDGKTYVPYMNGLLTRGAKY